MKYPTISLISVCLDEYPDIIKTVSSVADQKNIYFEYIVVDGGSSDGTLEYLQECLLNGSIDKLIVEKPQGVYNAINTGIKNASGMYIQLLHVGTLLSVDSIENLLNDLYQAISTHRPLPIMAASACWSLTDPQSKRFEIRSRLKNISFTNTKILHETLLIPRLTTDQKLNLYDTRYQICSDLNLVWSYLKSIDQSIVYSDIILIRYSRPWGISAQNLEKKIYEQFLIQSQFLPWYHSYFIYIVKRFKLFIKFLVKK